MEKKLLHVIYTPIRPIISISNSSIEDIMSEMWNTEGFLERIREKCPGFDFPYLTLNGSRFFVCQGTPLSVFGGIGGIFEKENLINIIKNYVEHSGEIIKKGDAPFLPMGERIKNYIQRNQPERIPLEQRAKSIVEFSEKELYPEVMEKLSERYDIQKIIFNPALNLDVEKRYP